jgi:hypothetical protein
MIAQTLLGEHGSTVSLEKLAVRLIGVGVSGLGSPPRQLSLWDAPIAATRKSRPASSGWRQRWRRSRPFRRRRSAACQRAWRCMNA